MCKDCVKSMMPDRGSLCSESGVYFANYKGCAKCNSLDLSKTDRVVEEEEGGEETIEFKHVCKACEHVIATHKYSFEVRDKYQEYTMECFLCGHGEDSRSVMPFDPRKASH